MNIITVLDLIGVFVFAMSGILAASEKKLDLFGGVIIAFVTALGGGTLRDLLMNVEIGWVANTTSIYVVISAVIFTLIFRKKLNHIRKTIFLFDSMGIGIFTIIGLQKAISFGMPIEIAVILGVTTATFGGVIRDILCNEIPLIFRKEIYATACIAGAVLFVVLDYFNLNEMVNVFISGSSIVLIRTLSVLKNYSLPIINDRL